MAPNADFSRRATQRSRLDVPFQALAFAIPLLVTVVRVSPTSQWRDDLAAVRSLGLVPGGIEGVVSTALGQLLLLIPVGTRLFRIGLLSAAAAALGSWLVYLLARSLLTRNAWSPRLTPALSLAAALSTTLSSPWQEAGTIAGGATVAAALLLGGLSWRRHDHPRDPRLWLGLSILLGLTAAESHFAAVALVLALTVQVVALGDLPSLRHLAMGAAASAVTLIVCLVPTLARPLLGFEWIGVGTQLTQASLAGQLAQGPQDAFSQWFKDVGMVSVGLALAGGLWACFRLATRWSMAPWVAFCVADLLISRGSGGVVTQDPLAPVRLMAVVGLALGAAIAVQSLTLAIHRVRIPFAYPATVLIVVFHFTLVLVVAESSSYAAGAEPRYGAEVWTEEALGKLPPRSLLLVRSQAVAWRLRAAASTRAARPDIVVVPLPLLGSGSVSTRLLVVEPALAALVREISVNGTPSEFSLSSLADQRPLFVELNPAWDRRLFDHLSPRPLWLGFSPHALGRSDRNVLLESGRASFHNILAAALDDAGHDSATLAVLGARAREQALALAALGDRENARHVMADLERIDPDDPFLLALGQRMDEKARGRVDIRGLLP